MWIGQLAKTCKYTSIRGYLAGVQSWHKDLGMPDPIRGKARLWRLWRGIKKEQGAKSTKKKLAITTAVAARLMEHIDRSHHDCRVLLAALLVGIYGFLRPGEFLSKRKGQSPLKLRNWSWTDEGDATISLEESKNDPFREGVSINIHNTSTSTCPVTAVRDMLSRSPHKLSSNDHLFRLTNGQPLSYGGMNRALSALIRRVGGDPRAYHGYSFRQGGALSAALAGVPDHRIRVLGRWESWAYQLYLPVSESQTRDAARAIAEIPHRFGGASTPDLLANPARLERSRRRG
jgi:hypothetical protein